MHYAGDKHAQYMCVYAYSHTHYACTTQATSGRGSGSTPCKTSDENTSAPSARQRRHRHPAFGLPVPRALDTGRRLRKDGNLAPGPGKRCCMQQWRHPGSRYRETLQKRRQPGASSKFCILITASHEKAATGLFKRKNFGECVHGKWRIWLVRIRIWREER